MQDSHSHSPQLSLAKDKIKVLLLEGINDSAVVEIVTAAGYTNVTRLPKALDGDALRSHQGRPHPRHPLAHPHHRRRAGTRRR